MAAWGRILTPIVQAISELDNITQANAADADEASTVAAEMEAQFDKLKNDITSLIKLVRGRGHQLEE